MSVENVPDKCGFDQAWQNVCLNPNPCAEHKDLKCISCGAPATRTCDATSSLVCGAPLCGSCEHELDEQGTNGYHFRHCKKSDQKYKPWYQREYEEKYGRFWKDLTVEERAEIEAQVGPVLEESHLCVSWKKQDTTWFHFNL